MSDLVSMLGQLRAVLAALEPADLTSGQCARLVAELSQAENACASARARVAHRAAASGAHRADGFRDAHEWMARRVGTSSSQARRDLETIAALPAHQATSEAVRCGAISLAQAGQVVSGAHGDTNSEADLLEIARTGSADAHRRGPQETSGANRPQRACGPSAQGAGVSPLARRARDDPVPRRARPGRRRESHEPDRRGNRPHPPRRPTGRR